MGARFPYGTFCSECHGIFLIGLVVTLVTNKVQTIVDPHWRYLLPIEVLYRGLHYFFCIFSMKLSGSMQDGKVLVASLNVVLSVTLGLAAVWQAALWQGDRSNKVEIKAGGYRVARPR